MYWGVGFVFLTWGRLGRSICDRGEGGKMTIRFANRLEDATLILFSQKALTHKNLPFPFFPIRIRSKATIAEKVNF